jgi:hypothetical protein
MYTKFKSGKPEVKRSLGRRRLKPQANIKMDFTETGNCVFCFSSCVSHSVMVTIIHQYKKQNRQLIHN